MPEIYVLIPRPYSPSPCKAFLISRCQCPYKTKEGLQTTIERKICCQRPRLQPFMFMLQPKENHLIVQIIRIWAGHRWGKENTIVANLLKKSQKTWKCTTVTVHFKKKSLKKKTQGNQKVDNNYIKNLTSENDIDTDIKNQLTFWAYPYLFRSPSATWRKRRKVLLLIIPGASWL